MKISAKKYAKALYDLSADETKTDVKKIVSSFLSVLKNNNDISRADEIIVEFENLWNKEKGIIEAEVLSARGLEAKEKKDIKQYIENKIYAKEIVLNEVIDKTVLGGVIVKYSGRILDGSLKTKISNLKEEMKK